MRTALLPILLAICGSVAGQDADQRAYWMRYVIAEDTSALIPLRGGYTVARLARGQWWNYQDPRTPGGFEVTPLTMLPAFSEAFPPLLATDARASGEAPEERLRIVRGRDTMEVYLPNYESTWRSQRDERCERMRCDRLPPTVLVFRKGVHWGEDALSQASAKKADDLTPKALTEAFDELWRKAGAVNAIVPQMARDTCRQELDVPADLDLPETRYREAWVMRSPYCATHFLHFPGWGTSTQYAIMFTPYQPTEKKDPVMISIRGTDDPTQWVNVSDWPIGDHVVRLLACGNGGTFTLKMR